MGKNIMDIQTYILSKKYTDESLSGAGALQGKSAYEIAVLNGFSGSEKEWLESLQGKTPDLTNYYTKEEIDNISMNRVNIEALSKEEIEEILKGD